MRDLKLIKLLRKKEYSKLLLANSISRMGDSIDAIAFSWLVYILTGSELLLGVTFAVNALPNLIFGAFTGVLADRFNKKRLMVLSFLGRGIAVLIIAIIYSIGYLRIWHILLFTAFNSTLEILMSPAAFSIMPKLIEEENYAEASGLSSSIYRFAELLGTGVAGVIIAKFSITGALLVDVATFLAASFIVQLIKYKEEQEEKSQITIKSTLIDVKEGFNYLKLNKIIMLIIGLFALINFCISPINVLLPVFSQKTLKGGPEIISILGMSLSLGTILGGVITASVAEKFKGNKLLNIGALGFGLSYTILVLPGYIQGRSILSLIIAALGFFLMGFMIPPMTASLTAHIMSKTDKKLLGRVSGIVSLVCTGMIPLGAALTGVMANYLSTSLIFLIMGAIIILVSMYLWISGSLETA